MTGKVIRYITIKNESDQFKTLTEISKRSKHELNHHLSLLYSLYKPLPRLKREWVLCDYPTIEKPNDFDPDVFKVLEDRGKILEVSKIGNPESPDIKILLDHWYEFIDFRLKPDETRFLVEETVVQDFYLEDVKTGFRTTVEHEFDMGNIESILVDELTTEGSDNPQKFIIGFKQKDNDFQPIDFNPTYGNLDVKIIGG